MGIESEEKFAWATDIDTILEVFELAKKRGKKAGDNIEQEFLEIMKKKNQKPLGTTKDDIDMIAGNMREKGIKVLNMKKMDRRNENNGTDKSH